MKKLLLIFATLLISLNSMALSFPRSAYGHQRILTNAVEKTAAQAQSLKSSLIKETAISVEEETNQQSFIQMVADYVIHLFTETICKRKSVAVVNTFEKERYECFAIKQDFEYQFIG
ncbi:hypothetical protein [Emticicia sp. 21SJ11W-3]|uniref:hypothetical protein n=1 Tax=Emticicia sp. 21SJ11W-3 TaxID=2916755 RepID=UPI00209EC912|nr:hypothetical protein [Emticicia sp. 21SJ11W-3]UTA68611.1 hypothetical protein MB380_02110 [Emticicia sp. 21SJ11W-3]